MQRLGGSDLERLGYPYSLYIPYLMKKTSSYLEFPNHLRECFLFEQAWSGFDSLPYLQDDSLVLNQSQGRWIRFRFWKAGWHMKDDSMNMIYIYIYIFIYIYILYIYIYTYSYIYIYILYIYIYVIYIYILHIYIYIHITQICMKKNFRGNNEIFGKLDLQDLHLSMVPGSWKPFEALGTRKKDRTRRTGCRILLCNRYGV